MFRLIFLTIFQFIALLAIAQNCSLRGIVKDAQNNEILPFANVKIVNTTIGVVTDNDGKFAFSNLEPGFVSLEVSFMGYKTLQTQAILLTQNKTSYMEVELEVADNLIADFVVRPSSFTKREEAPISMQSIGVDEIESNPGSNRDISRVIQSFPGVGSTPAFRNDIIIRGGGPAENRFYLDGIEIPILNHFSTQGASGGPVGIINADFIRNVDFYASSFPAARYNALSGVFDFRQKNGNLDKLAVQLALGASETSLTLDGPAGKKTNYIVSVRRSYLQFLFAAIGLPFLPTFNDYQVRVRSNIDKKNQLTVISIGSLDNLKLNTEIENPEPGQEYLVNSLPVNNQWSYTIGVEYKHFFDKGFHTFVLSRNMLDNQVYKHIDNDENKAKQLDYNSSEAENKFRYEYHLRSNGVKYVLSANLEYAKYYNKSRQRIVLFDKIMELDYQSSFDMLKYGASAQASKYFFNKKLQSSLGVRIDANNYNSESSNPLNQLSPRLSLSYSLNSKNKINASAGRYFQQAAYTSLGFKNNEGVMLNKNTAKYIGLNQYNFGFEHLANSNVLFSVEAFYKQYFNYPIDISTGSSLANQGAGYSIYGASALDFTGKGKAYGVEFLNRLNYKSFTMLTSYTFFRSLFSDFAGFYIPSAWDSKHLLTVTASKSLKKHWQIGIKWRYVGSLPYTPYDIQLSSNKEVWFINRGPYLNYYKLNSERFKPFHQLDLRIDKKFFFKSWSLILYLDIQNVYNYKSELRDIILRKKNADGTFVTVNEGRDYVLESYPNTIGTVLPSVGVMIKF